MKWLHYDYKWIDLVKIAQPIYTKYKNTSMKIGGLFTNARGLFSMFFQKPVCVTGLFTLFLIVWSFSGRFWGFNNGLV